MAVKKWGLLDGKVTNIDTLSKELQKEYQVSCCGCGECLIPKMGDKNDWYFSHKSDTNCHGGSPETVLHKLVKDVISSNTSINLPSGVIPVWKDVKLDVFSGGMYGYNSSRVFVEKKFGDVIPDVTIDMGYFWLFIEVYVRHKTSESKRKKYANIGEPFVVVEIDMRRYADKVDELSYDYIKDAVVMDVSNKEVIQSTDMIYYEKMYKDSLFTIPNGMLLCPATDFKDIVESRSCHKCMYYVGKGVCTGRSCLVKKSDYIVRDQTKQDRFDLHYSELNPVPPVKVGEAKYFSKRWFGSCSCGGELEICTGERKGDVIRIGVPVAKGYDDEYAYTRCKECSKVTPIFCPENHNHQMNICYNKHSKGSQRIFLACEYYQNSMKYCTDPQCSASITLYDGIHVGDNYSDELKAVGGLPKFLKKDARGMARLNELKSSRKYGVS